MNNKLKVLICVSIILLIVFGQAVSVFADTYYGVLRYGSRGTGVVRVQQALNSKGYSAGAADGIYGARTRNAVVSYQKATGLLVDGIAGRQTQSKLFASTAAKASTYTTTAARGTTFTSTDLHWMSRIIHAEAEAEPYEGKLAVGNVILNRMKSSAFPNTIKGVIFEYYNHIPQFSPVADGTIYNTPNADSVKAAKAVFGGANVVENSTYFFNPDKSEGTWIVRNKTLLKRIGNHVFYK